MSWMLNESLLNGDIFQAGTGDTTFVSLLGDVSAVGELGAIVAKGLTAGQIVYATPVGGFTRVIGLSAEQIAQAVPEARPGDYFAVALVGTQVVTAEPHGRFTVAHYMRGTQPCTVESVASLINRKQLQATQPCYANHSGAVGSYPKCSASQIVTAEPAAELKRKIGLVGMQPCYALCTAATGLDTLPAPDERTMLVPYEDRRMLVT